MATLDQHSLADTITILEAAYGVDDSGPLFKKVCWWGGDEAAHCCRYTSACVICVFMCVCAYACVSVCKVPSIVIIHRLFTRDFDIVS